MKNSVGPVGAVGGAPLINPFLKQLRAAAIDVTVWLL